MQKKGIVYWITGLSGAGKTTVGIAFRERLLERQDKLIFLDGDNTRQVFNDQIGYSREDRRDGAFRLARVCKMISDQGIDVICCTISMFDDVREWNRMHISDYYEIYLDVPIEILIKRDQKGLYSGIKGGKVTDVAGMDISIELPKHPNLTIHNDGSECPDVVADKIFKNLIGDDVL